MSASSERGQTQEAMVARFTLEHGLDGATHHALKQLVASLVAPTLEAEYAAALPDDQVVSGEADRAFRFAIQEADRRFASDGAAGSKTWFRDYLVPELGKRGLRITSPALSEG